jgi:PIN domain nuclease of toxin-antitoxin system
MRYLIDTNVLIWAATETRDFSKKVSAIINDKDCEIYVSIASLWEIAIKKSIRKLTINDDIFDDLESHGYILLPVTIPHLKSLLDLPHHHNDPFDRILVAQALHENLTILTSDRKLKPYNAKIILA